MVKNNANCNCCETNSENNGKCNCCDLSLQSPLTSRQQSAQISSENSMQDCSLDLTCCKIECVKVCLRETQECCKPKSTNNNSNNIISKAYADICKCPPSECMKDVPCCEECPGIC